MVAGEKEQLKLTGIPAQESEIGALNAPACAFAETVNPPFVPAAIVTVAGAALKDRAEVELLPAPPPPHEER